MTLETAWYGAGSYEPWDGESRPAGIMMPLAAFTGGTGSLTNVYGIRILYPYANDSGLDPLVIGSYTAKNSPLAVYDAEFDPMPTATPDSDHVGGEYRDPWTLTSISLGPGRYTDLEGPANVIFGRENQDWEYCIDDPNPPTSAAESALGLDSSGLMNANDSKWLFDTTVTNGFDGGFFVMVNTDNNFTILPLDTDTNAISGYSIAIDKAYELAQRLESDAAIPWRRVYGNPPNTANVTRNLRGTSIKLGCFTHETTGEPLTNDVIGIQLTDSPSIDPFMVGLYKGPPDPPPVPGCGVPITGVTFTPPLLEGVSQYSNDAAVVSIESDNLTPWAIAPADDVYILSGGSETYYPYNGTNPDPDGVSPWDDGYTNALDGFDIDGVFNVRMSDYMFDRPIRNAEDGFFIIGRYSYITRVRPLAADRTPMSTYSVLLDYPMYDNMGLTHDWRIRFGADRLTTAWMRGTMISKADFAGGTGEIGPIYGIRIEDSFGEFDPAVVGKFFGPLTGTVILVR